jgi:hypothetical protein
MVHGEVHLIRPVTMAISQVCHAHLIRWHISQKILFGWNREEREKNRFTMVKRPSVVTQTSVTLWNPRWGWTSFHQRSRATGGRASSPFARARAQSFSRAPPSRHFFLPIPPGHPISRAPPAHRGQAADPPAMEPPPDLAAMEPPPAVGSLRRGGGRGGKPRGGKQLGLKRPAAPPRSSGSPSPPAPPPPPISAGDASMSSPSPTTAAASSSPAGRMFNVPPRAPQGGGWGAIPPNFPFCGDLQGSNSW